MPELDDVDWLSDDSGDGCIPVFRMEAVQNAYRTREEGRPIFDDVPYVKVLIPGGNKNVPDYKVRDEDKERWPRQWRAFIDKREAAVDGVPIEQWPRLSVSQVAEFKAINIFTVEQIAGMKDAGLEKMGPGARELQKEAKRFLMPQSKKETDLRTENQELRAALEQMGTRVATLEREIGELEAKKAA